MKKETAKKSAARRVLDARPDTLDFRDKMYVPTLIEVPSRIPLESYRQKHIPILDQGLEGACTGFGLATVANYLLSTRRVEKDANPVSARMLYEMAKRYDEWPGERYSGSSARGAMKGWHKHGICTDKAWPYRASQGSRSQSGGLNDARTADALRRPLGAYFRVNHKDLVAMHAAIAEVGILYATAIVHAGWDSVGADGLIPYSEQVLGGHAFAIVAYDENGLWIQNSWSAKWGRGGFGCISYDDWLEHGSDVWVARLGAPVVLRKSTSTAVAYSAAAGESVSYAFSDLRPHIISLKNNGDLNPGGDYGTSPADVATLFKTDIPGAIKSDGYQHLVLYAHGGLVGERTAVQRLADYRPAMLAAGVYPLSFIWHSDYWSTLKNILQDALQRRRPEGVLDRAKDFMLDRLDDALEPLARTVSGKAAWDEMKENALAATTSAEGGARLVVGYLAALSKTFPKLKIHVVGHSAGSIFHAPLVSALRKAGVAIESCTLWAPACTIDLFKKHYLPAIKRKEIQRMAVFALSDKTERDDDCAKIYNKSLLYLVSHAFEDKPRIPLFRDGVPILGMEKHLRADPTLMQLFEAGQADLVIAPNTEPLGTDKASTARHHGDFDDDEATVKATLQRLLGVTSVAEPATMPFQRSASSLRERRAQVERSATS